MQKLMWLDEQVCACELVPGWNAPQGVDNVHTLCAGKSESDERGNNISVKRYIKVEYYYYSSLCLLSGSRILWLHLHRNLHHWDGTEDHGHGSPPSQGRLHARPLEHPGCYSGCLCLICLRLQGVSWPFFDLGPVAIPQCVVPDILHSLPYRYTVKPALVTTCLQWPSVYKDHICCFPWKCFLIESCTKGICLQRPPVYKGHFWMVAIARFDCIMSFLFWDEIMKNRPKHWTWLSPVWLDQGYFVRTIHCAMANGWIVSYK